VLRISGASRGSVLALNDLSGRMVRNAFATEAENTTLDVSGLPKGIYILEIVSGSVVQKHKIVVQ
jgi:hypothetical protein